MGPRHCGLRRHGRAWCRGEFQMEHRTAPRLGFHGKRATVMFGEHVITGAVVSTTLIVWLLVELFPQ